MKNKFIKNVLILAGIVFLLFFLWEISNVIVYLAISFVFLLIGKPMMNLLERVKVGRFYLPPALSAFLVVVVFIAFLGGVILMFVPLIMTQAQNLSLLNTETLQHNFSQAIDTLSGELIRLRIIHQPLNIEEEIFKYLNMSVVTNFVNSLVSTVSSVATGLFAVLFMTFFFLKDKGMVSGFILSAVNDRNVEKMQQSIDKSQRILSRYLIGLIIQLILVFILYLVTLLIFDVRNPLIIAFLGALFNVIPYLGPLMGYVVITSLTLLSHTDLPSHDLFMLLIKVSACFVGCQLIDNFVNQPLIFSNSVKAHPIEIFIVILIGGTLFGIIGMIVAVPAYSIMRVLAKEFFPEYKIVQALTRNI